MRRLILAGAALFFLLIYLLTLRPGVLPADSGEFQWVALTLGVAHPPGFSFYTLIAHLFTYLPGDPARNVNLFSAITSAFTLFFFGLTLLKLIRTDRPDSTPPVLFFFSCLSSLFFLGTSTTFWAQATTANIRSLTTLFAAVWFWLIVDGEDDARSDRQKWNLLFWMIFLFALGISHHLSLLFMGVMMGSLLLMRTWHLFKSFQVWLSLIGAGLLGLLPWLYLPLRDPNLRDPLSFIRYVLGLGFSSDFFFVATWPQLFERSGVMLNVLTFQFSLAVLLIALLGLLLLLWNRPWVGALVGGTFLIHTLIAATYRAPQTVEYMLPAYLPILLCFGYALWFILTELVQRLGQLGANERWLPLVSAGLASVLVLATGWGQLRAAAQNWRSYRILASQHDTLEMTSLWLNALPENGLILADWHWFTPLNYVRLVQNEASEIESEIDPDIEIDYRPGQDWNRSIREGLGADRSVLSTHFEPDQFAGLPPAIPVGEGWLYPADLNNERLFSSLTLDIMLGDQIEMNQYHLSRSELIAGEEVILQIAWRPLTDELPPLTLFAHLVGGDGQLYAQADIPAQTQPVGNSVTQFRLTPRPGLPLGEARILIGGYLSDGTPLLDQQGESRSEVETGSVIGSNWAPHTENRLRGERNDLGWVKYGTDWDRTIPGEVRQYVHWRLPDGTYWTEVLDYPAAGGDHPLQYYVPFGQGIVWTGSFPRFETQLLRPGETLAPNQRFVASRPLLRDIGIAVRLIGLEEDLYTWAWLNSEPDNDIPATGAIPTLKWVIGSEVYHPRRLTISPEASNGQTVEGFLRLYDTFNREPVPILDERITNSGRPWVVFDAGTIE